MTAQFIKLLEVFGIRKKLRKITDTETDLAIAGNTAVTGTLSATGSMSVVPTIGTNPAWLFFNNDSGAPNSYIGQDGSVAGLDTAYSLNVWNGSNTPIIFGVNNAKVGSWTTTGLAVTGVVDLSNASSGQIKFPATQNASANANTLDDYEEGTWTAAVLGSVSNPTIPVTATGHYTKIGRMVTAIFDISSFNTTGASGNVQIAGLPFTSLASDPRTAGTMYFSRSSAACMAFLEPGSTTITSVDYLGNAVTHGSVGAGTYAAASITYFV